MKKLSLILVSCVLLTGCGRRVVWNERYEPVSNEDRKQILDHAEKILAATPRSLAGDDQDWDDAIKEAHRQAKAIVCKPTFWEYDYPIGAYEVGRYTGRWKYADQIPTQ